MTEGTNFRSFPRNGSRASDVSFARYPRADLVVAGGPGTCYRTLVNQGEKCAVVLRPIYGHVTVFSSISEIAECFITFL